MGNLQTTPSEPRVTSVDAREQLEADIQRQNREDLERVMQRGRPPGEVPPVRGPGGGESGPSDIEGYLYQHQRELARSEAGSRFPNAIDSIKAGLMPEDDPRMQRRQ